MHATDAAQRYCQPAADSGRRPPPPPPLSPPWPRTTARWTRAAARCFGRGWWARTASQSSRLCRSTTSLGHERSRRQSPSTVRCVALTARTPDHRHPHHTSPSAHRRRRHILGPTARGGVPKDQHDWRWRRRWRRRRVDRAAGQAQGPDPHAGRHAPGASSMGGEVSFSPITGPIYK